MPKILIHEENNTSAGTPGRYGNFSVLITGYKGTPSTDETKWQKPDENGVYEFTSKQAFVDTIGLLSDTAKKDQKGNTVEYHYGNKMAYHLLNLGYTVIYKVIDSVADMLREDFWAIFKDKASYDFRFISHGLLETCYDAEAHSTLHTRLKALEADVKKIAEIKESVESTEAFEEATSDLVKGELYNDEYEKVYLTYDGFYDEAGVKYSNWASASAQLITTKTLEDGTELPVAIAEQKARIEEHNENHFTIDNFNRINGNIAKIASYRTTEDRTTTLCDGRGDCIALIELDEDCYCESTIKSRPEVLIAEGISNMASSIGDDGKYCAMTVPSVYCKTGGKEPEKLPSAFYYLACFMNSLSSGFAEWYAAAGYTRGVSNYIIDHTSVKLGEIAIAALEPRYSATLPFACNVIANFRGSYYLWGNRTAAELGKTEQNDLTADHFLNIRQLCSTIKKQLYVSCRRFTFDPNSDTLWVNFVNSITPTLEAMKADQGIRDYKVVKEFTDKKATLKARIRIIPIEAVEDFDITVSLEDSFGGVSVTAE